MARGAAKEQQLGALHAKITDVFIKVLARYEARLDALENVTTENITEEILDKLLEDGAMPNPAMLSAVTKFLKDNDIGFETEKLSELSDQERRLEERRKKRPNLVDLSTLRPVATGTDG